MAIKLNIAQSTLVQAKIDMVEAAQECVNAYQDLLQAGFECDELFRVIDNIQFCRDAIAQHGAEWYINNCDPLKDICSALDIAEESLSAKKIDSAMEGVVQTVVTKISEWVRRFCTWVASFFKQESASAATAATESAAKTNNEIKEEVKADPKKAQEIASTPVPVVEIVIDENVAKEIQDAIQENSFIVKNLEAAKVEAPSEKSDESKPVMKLPVIPPVKLADYSKLRVKIKKVGADASENANGVSGHMLGLSQLQNVHMTLAGSVKTLQTDQGSIYKSTYVVFNNITKKDKSSVSIMFDNLRTCVKNEVEYSKKFNNNCAAVIAACKKLPMVPNRKDAVTAGDIGIKTPSDLDNWIHSTTSIINLQRTGENLSDGITNGIKKLEADIVTPFKNDASAEAITVLKFANRSISLCHKTINTFRFVSTFSSECAKFADSVAKSIKGHIQNTEREMNEHRPISTSSSSSSEPARMAAKM